MIQDYVQRVLFTLCFFSLLSCAHKPHIRGRDIHPQLAEYVASFEATYGIQVNYPVEIAALSEQGYDGVCKESSYQYGSEVYTQKIIQIDITFLEAYAKAYPLYIEQVVFHEIAHCSFEEPHDNTIIETGIMSGCPLSLMYDTSFYGCYLQHKEYYVEELRNRMGL